MTAAGTGERGAQLAYSEKMAKMTDEAHRRRKAAKILAVLRHVRGQGDLNGLTVVDVGCSAGSLRCACYAALMCERLT